MKRLLFVAVLAFLGWHCSKQSDPEEPKKKEEVLYSSNITALEEEIVPVDEDNEIVFCEL